MTSATRLKLSFFFTLLAIALLGISLVGAATSPRPAWTRTVLAPALIFVLVGHRLRRGVRRSGQP